MSARHLHRQPRLERLENRQVLAAFGPELVEGVLTIEGTNQNDRIFVSFGGEFSDQLSVSFNGTETLFNPAEVTELRVNAWGGNDCVCISDAVLLGATVDGGNGNDWLRGGGGNDTLLGGRGNDRMFGSLGDDVLAGDGGNDRMWGGAGNDTVDGGYGHDWAYGEDGDDVLTGGYGHDHLFGGAGVDTAWGGDGKDHLHGGDDNDVLHGEGDKDHLKGGLGDDELHGGDANDHVLGQGGNDWLYGDGGWDKLWGGAGDDNIKGGSGNDHLWGGEGVNLLDGDEGVNKLFGGTEYDFENPPLPPEPPQDPQFVTHLTCEGTVQGYLVYTKKDLGDGTFEEELEIFVSNGVGGDTLPIVIGSRVLGFLVLDPLGQAYVRFSTMPDFTERAFPMDFVLVDGAEVSVGPELSGQLNLTVA
jgi:Ca2+-binding RTX toxin-like protein